VSDRSRTGDAHDRACIPQPAERVLAVIWPLLGRHIAYHRRLVDLTGNVKAALMLSQSIYWTRHGRDIARHGGWFVKTVEQWQRETGLSLKEQATARATLRALSVLEEQRLGVPAKLHFRLAVDRFGILLSERLGCRAAPVDWSDAALIAELLGPSIAFHRILADVAGGVHGGLMLSRALYLTRLQRQRRLEPWVCDAEAWWQDTIGLTRREQETARQHLGRAGLWEERLAGVPPRRIARIGLERLLALLAEGPLRLPSSNVTAHPSGCGVSASKPPPNGDPSVRGFHRLESPKAPDQVRRNGDHSLAQSAEPHIKGSTSGSVQPPATPAARDGDASVSCGGELVFPEALLPEERVAATVLLRRCTHHAQALLDELAGRLQAKSVRTSAVAYLRGLVNRAAAGTFVPELGLQVAAARRRRGEDLAQRQQRAAEADRLASERAEPSHRAMVAARREQIWRLLAAMKADAGTGEEP
jgi:hypothetical protein